MYRSSCRIFLLLPEGPRIYMAATLALKGCCIMPLWCIWLYLKRGGSFLPKLTTGREIASRRRLKKIKKSKSQKVFTFRLVGTFRLFATFSTFRFSGHISTFRNFSTFRDFSTFRVLLVILRLCPRTAARDHSFLRVSLK